MNIKPIKTKTDYKLALKRVEALWDAKPKTPQGDELDVLATLLIAYEESHFSIAAPLSLSMIRKLSSGLNIPAQSLIQEYPLSGQSP